jgi:hypothetical protein
LCCLRASLDLLQATTSCNARSPAQSCAGRTDARGGQHAFFPAGARAYGLHRRPYARVPAHAVLPSYSGAAASANMRVETRTAVLMRVHAHMLSQAWAPATGAKINCRYKKSSQGLCLRGCL